MTLTLHNTLTRRQEPFAPLAPPRVTLYSCGPTVWNYAHIGNFRTFLFVDLLRRWLEASGFDVFHIMNLTDVDDRIIKEAGKQGVTIADLVAPFVVAFNEDRDYLRITPAHEYPRATEFVAPMIRLVEGLLANGAAYRGEDGSVYFSIAKFPAYGRLSQLDKRELKAGASGRISSDEYDKENAQDFVLWKAAKPEDEAVAAAWDAPFGRGRPGWHLECSAMALELIGRRYGAKVLDIHTGGVDLIFPHHEDEIAQSCAFTGEPDFAKVWMHAEFLNVRGTKMSKRFGNITTPRDLRTDGVEPGAIRLLVYQTHYRQRLDLTDHALAAAREGSRRLGEFARRLEAAGAPADGAGFLAAAERLSADFTAALDDDLNAPRAVAAVFEFVTAGNRLLDQGEKPGPRALESWGRTDRVLDVATQGAIYAVSVGQARGPATVLGVGADAAIEDELAEAPPIEADAQSAWALAWARRRGAAKSRRDFKDADRIRDLLKSHGWEVRDTKDGSSHVTRA
ncbi:MAG: cysteine--tRNA ligase [Gemmatimonadales bacterium]|nr:cysteine--tRNA ligase [Gemmatimonadales bacterium]